MQYAHRAALLPIDKQQHITGSSRPRFWIRRTDEDCCRILNFDRIISGIRVIGDNGICKLTPYDPIVIFLLSFFSFFAIVCIIEL
jgi:hypothetical protein